jgi:membrane protein required for colicin V production
MLFSWLDVILIAIMLLSGFLAMLRGLTREMLAVMSWAMAALATAFLYQLYEPTAQHYIKPEILAKVTLGGGIFITVLIVASLITIKLSDKILDSRVGAIDRTLGFVFGLARGLLLVVICYELAGVILRPETGRPIREGMPQWVQDANALPFIEKTGEAIISLLPDDPRSFFRNSSRDQAADAADEGSSDGAPAARRRR